ncbi:MAG: hypothetical protein IJQ74_05680 [Synergistaceae bacterium]|nr:hypothetical protein [Synergistaceae bacterium]
MTSGIAGTRVLFCSALPHYPAVLNCKFLNLFRNSLENITLSLEPVEYLKFALYSRAFMKIHKNRIFSCHQRDESSIFKKMLNRLLEISLENITLSLEISLENITLSLEISLENITLSLEISLENT